MKTKTPFAKPLIVAAMIASAFAVGGCGNDSEADLANGKTLFVQKCGACHVLSAAGATSGQIGPNLDEAFARAREDGMGDSTIASVTEQQILYPGKGNSLAPELVMPADLVTGSDARDVAAYVGAVAGKPAEKTDPTAKTGAPDADAQP